MRRQQYNFLIVFVVLCICLFSINVYAADAKPDATRLDTAPEEWEFVLEVYGWAATIDGTTATGTDFEIDFDTIVENLDFTLMSVLGARKDKLAFLVDVLYMDLEDSDNTNLGSLLKLSDIELKAWVVDPFVSYRVIDGERFKMALLAGARYLWIEVDLELKDRPPLPPATLSDSGDGDVWDAVVGIRGQFDLSDRWFMLYHLDIGTGDSDVTWQTTAGGGYRFDKFEIAAAYRYMKWEFDDDSVLDDLEIKGPLVGARFVF
jgi:hypothetical protein